jgi:hypothetical protein
MSEENIGKYFRVRIKTFVGDDKSANSYIVRARDVNEADAKMKIYVRKLMQDNGIEHYTLEVLSVVDMNVEDFIV